MAEGCALKYFFVRDKGVIEDVSWEQGSEADEGAGRNREPLSN